MGWYVFDRIDSMRRTGGNILDFIGSGPVTTPAREIFSDGLLTLKSYGSFREIAVLIVPAPFKRSYIWDILPDASVVRRFLREQIKVYMIEWQRPGNREDAGLAEYAETSISKCLSFIERETGRKKLFIAGNSLGGTLAAVFSCLHTEKVKGLILIGAPLSFGPGTGDIDRLVAMGPFMNSARGNVPGSFLNTLSFIASPAAFAFDRWADWLMSLADAEAMRLHLCVERWSLDESPLSRRLFEEVTEQLYRKNLFMLGKLKVGGTPVLPDAFDAPLLAVLDEKCSVVPPRSTLPFLDAAKSVEKKILWYSGDVGVSLRHVGALVGRSAHQHLWPEIVAWVKGIR